MIQQGAIYRADQVLSELKVSQKTLGQWIKDGLRFSQRSTKFRYFLGDDLISFFFPTDKASESESS